MIYEPSLLAVVVFLLFVGFTLGLSFYLGNRAQSSQGYFAAHGEIPWFVNGVAFAGDYLSAASFLGICGMIAFYGYDGFLYSIGYLAGWIVALFVVAEPVKRLGKYTFADALNAQFDSTGIKLAAGVSTLAVSVFYLIPQMVGAGVLIQPLLGMPHWVGVVVVGTTVIIIVVTAGMVSTTWVQFLKGSLLVVFSAVLTFLILGRGFTVADGGDDGYAFGKLGPFPVDSAADAAPPNTTLLPGDGDWEGSRFRRYRDNDTGIVSDRVRRTGRARRTSTAVVAVEVVLSAVPVGHGQNRDPRRRPNLPTRDTTCLPCRTGPARRTIPRRSGRGSSGRRSRSRRSRPPDRGPRRRRSPPSRACTSRGARTRGSPRTLPRRRSR